jgi:2-polyprenyl-3-methyl-5-hydroxy-6-metoxy-1,4-benzoquinol methylase
MNGINCPICNVNQDINLVKTVNVLPKKKLKLDLIKCTNCQHDFFFTTEHHQKIIETIYNDSYKGYRKDNVFETNLKRICKEILPPANKDVQILDVGCGRGDFLFLVNQMGYKSMGIDISTDAKDICLERGLNAVSGDFLDYEFSDKMNVITFWDVMEHLRYPFKFLKRASELISPDGIIVIKVPFFNKTSLFLASISPLMARSLLGAPDHIQFYSKSSLNKLARNCGLDVVELKSIGSIRSKPNMGLGFNYFKQKVISTIKGISGDGNYLIVLKKNS